MNAISQIGVYQLRKRFNKIAYLGNRIIMILYTSRFSENLSTGWTRVI